MSDIWTNFSSEKLIKLIGEDQLADIETILPVIDISVKPNDFQKRKTLAKIFESFEKSHTFGVFPTASNCTCSYGHGRP